MFHFALITFQSDGPPSVEELKPRNLDSLLDKVVEQHVSEEVCFSGDAFHLQHFNLQGDSTKDEIAPKKKSRMCKVKEESSDSTDAQDSDVAGEKARRLAMPSIEWTDGCPPYDLELLKLTTTSASVRKESLCGVCEKPNELLHCVGPCLGHFHAACLGLSVVPTSTFKCDECSTG